MSVDNNARTPTPRTVDIFDSLFIENRMDGVWLVCVGGVHSSMEEAQNACREWKLAHGGSDCNAVEKPCSGCGKKLLLENAWMEDGCPCNTPAGINNFNLYRWKLLHDLQQKQSHKLSALETELAAANERIEFLIRDNQHLETVFGQATLMEQGMLERALAAESKLAAANERAQMDTTHKESQ